MAKGLVGATAGMEPPRGGEGALCALTNQRGRCAPRSPSCSVIVAQSCGERGAAPLVGYSPRRVATICSMRNTRLRPRKAQRICARARSAGKSTAKRNPQWRSHVIHSMRNLQGRQARNPQRARERTYAPEHKVLGNPQGQQAQTYAPEHGVLGNPQRSVIYRGEAT